MNARPELSQRLSHRNLLRAAPPSRSGRVDAVVVPSVREPTMAASAIALASELDATLLVLHTDARAAEAVNQRLEQDGAQRSLAITLPPAYAHPWLPRTTTLECHSDATLYPDLSTKRNIALILASLVGWNSVLFLDDDIRGLAARSVRNAAGWLRRPFRAIGWTVSGFPDNSVVCHAVRHAGLAQDVFVSGSALLVDASGPLPFFPPIYNEDWLMLWGFVAQGLVGCGGNVEQVAYDPFDDPHRAGAQEFGDVMAEGLMTQLHDPRTANASGDVYWSRFLDARRRHVANVYDQLPSECTDARTALVASLTSSETILPTTCSRFVHLWRRDLEAWKRTQGALPHVDSLSDALALLHLQP